MNKSLLSLLVLVTLVCACKPGVPRSYIQPGKMEDILYDYHVADGMAEDEISNEQLPYTYRAAVLKKHGVTQAEFDSSMVYYMRHTERLHDIYKNLADRLSDEAIALGASEGEVNKYTVLTASGDTANIWTGDPSMVLMPMQPYNTSTFVLPADTAFRAGDRIQLNFDSQFIFQDGIRDGVVVLAVRFKNDSVASQVVHVSSTQRYTLAVEDRDTLGIKEVRGFFHLSKGNRDESQTTLKLLFIKNIVLVRMHPQKKSSDKLELQPKPLKHGKDSAPGGVPDSLRRAIARPGRAGNVLRQSPQPLSVTE